MKLNQTISIRWKNVSLNLNFIKLKYQKISLRQKIINPNNIL